MVPWLEENNIDWKNMDAEEEVLLICQMMFLEGQLK